MKRRMLILSILVCTVGCDQMSKEVARRTLSLHETHVFLGGVVKFEHTLNPGAFLSLGSWLSPSTRFWIFTVFVGLVLFGIGFYIFKNNLDKYQTISLSLLLGGGIGNLIDRSLHGAVTDFVSMGLGPLRTGVFNFADMAILVSVFLLFFQSFFTKLISKNVVNSN